MEDLESVFIVAITFFSFVTFVKILSDNKVRSKLIEKGVVNENVKYLAMINEGARPPASLKWGMVLIGIGLAFLIGQLVPSRISEEITIGCLFLFAGIGLTLYYLIVKKMGGGGNNKSPK